MATLEDTRHTRIAEHGDEFVLTIELPHVHEHGLEIEIERHELRVRAEGLDESVELPATVDPWQLRLSCGGDVLEVHARKTKRVLLDPESTPC